ncbi:MAG: MFS transporter [Anaerolineaceae bacterium]
MNRSYLFIILSLFTWGVGEGLFLYFQPLYLQQLGANPVLIGTILGVMGVVMALAQVPAGKLADRVGSRSLMVASWTVGTAAALLMAFAKTLPVFAVGLIIYGASGFSISAMNRYIIDVRGKFTVGRSLTLASGLYNLGAVVGPVTGGLLANKYGYQTIFFVSFVVFVISTILILSIEKHPPVHHEDSNSQAAHGMTRNPAFFFFAAMVFMLIISLDLAQPLTPNFLQNQQGFDPALIGIMGSVGNLGNALSMLLLGSLRPIVGMLAGQTMVAGFAALFLFGNSPVLFGMGYFLFGGFRLSKTMVLAFARPLVHPEETGLAFGILETVSAFAIILAPVIAGVLYDQSPRLMYEVAFGAVLGSILITSFGLPRIQKKFAATVDEQIVTVDDD